MKWTVRGLSIATLLSLPTVYAGDCSTSFDQSCLASGYNREQVERDLELKEAKTAAEIQAQEEKAEKEARKAREEEREYRAMQRRESEERLQAYRDGLPDRTQKYREQLEAIKEKYEESTEDSFFRQHGRPLRSR